MTPILEKAMGLIEHAKAVSAFENKALELSRRIILTSLPMLLVSFMLPALLPLIVPLSAFGLYHMVKDIQHKTISLDQAALLWSASLPVYLFFIAWCLALALTGRPANLSSIATYFLLAVICLWPTFVNRKKHIEQQKQSPFKPLYLAVSGILAVQQILAVI